MNISPMKRLLALPLLAALSLSCTSDTAPVRLLGAIALPFGATETCAPTGDVQQLAGSLDVAPIGAGAFLIGFNFESSLVDTDTDTVGGNPVGGSGGNDFILQEVRLSYTSEPSLNIPAATLPRYGVFPAESSEDSFITTNLITPQALAALRGAALPVNGLTLNVTVQLAGQLGSGRDIETNEAVFPITITNSGLTSCPTGTAQVASGPCGSLGGQDGAPICAVPTP